MKRWTKIEDARLIDLWEADCSWSEIASQLSNEFGRCLSDKAVMTRGRRLKLHPREWGKCSAWIDEHVEHDGDECLIWPFHRGNKGRGVIRVDGKSIPAPREMCRRAHGEPPTPRHEAAHSCLRAADGCINPRHLSWKTHRENMADKVRDGTDNRGLKHPRVKLTEDQVREIRALEGKMTRAAIGALYGVTKSGVQGIHNRRKWAWLE